MKAFWTSKTLWFSLLTLIVGVAGAFGFVDFEAPEWLGSAVVIIVAAVNAWLRFKTDKALGLRNE